MFNHVTKADQKQNLKQKLKISNANLTDTKSWFDFRRRYICWEFPPFKNSLSEGQHVWL